MKQEHKGIGDNINVLGDLLQPTIEKHPSILAGIINELGSKLFQDDQSDTGFLKSFDIAQKIEHNHVVKYRDAIENNKVYQGKLNAIYTELDSEGSLKKTFLLRNIQNCYLKAKGKGEYLARFKGKEPIEVVRANSDNIIGDIENDLLNEICNSDNIAEPIEVIKVGLMIVLVDAFMRCKILEEPVNQ